MSLVELSRKMVVARKPHACWVCGANAAKVGETYERASYVYDGAAYTLTSCAACVEITSDVYDWVDGGWRDEGIHPDDYFEWAGENPDDERAVALLARIHGGAS